MSILGIAPLLLIVGAATALVAVVSARLLGFGLSLPLPWREWALAIGAVLIAIGVFFWIAGGLLLKRAYDSHRLTTTGVYGVSRNPMYAGFIVFIAPGLALALNQLMLLLVPLAMFVAFKLSVGREEDYLAKEFGAEYERYRGSVSQLAPLIPSRDRRCGRRRPPD